MAALTTETLWKDGMAFENTANGHTFMVDAADKFGGRDTGPRPKTLMLNALAGCTGMDVISILRKMKQEFTWFNIKADGSLGKTHPKVYTDIHLTFQFKKADNLDDKKVRKAITLSQDSYCGVAAMLKKACPVTWEVEYLD